MIDKGFNVGNVKIKNRVVMAPMAGIGNQAFRRIIKEMGTGLIYTEMVSDKGIGFNNEKTLKMLDCLPEEKPVSLQIFGDDEETITKAAIVVDKNTDCDIIDINMGCPVPKVCKKGQAGASLLKDSNKIFRIVKSVVENTTKPVSCKIRSGWDFETINAVEVAKLIEKAGASLIAVHGRTRSQMYTGKVDLEIIKKVKEAVNIPVIGNGDIKSVKEALHMLSYTKCDAIMIGRGLLGNPWLAKEIVCHLETGIIIEKPTIEEKLKIIFKHLKYLQDLKGEKVAVLEFRAHLAWYIKGLPKAKIIKGELFKVKEINELKEYINSYFQELSLLKEIYIEED